jgi:hypothetical protein
MDVSATNQMQMQSQMQQLQRASGDNEAAERMPDNEMTEIAAVRMQQGQNQEDQQSQMSIAATSSDSSGLSPWQGQNVDVTA